MRSTWFEKAHEMQQCWSTNDFIIWSTTQKWETQNEPPWSSLHSKNSVCSCSYNTIESLKKSEVFAIVVWGNVIAVRPSYISQKQNRQTFDGSWEFSKNSVVSLAKCSHESYSGQLSSSSLSEFKCQVVKTLWNTPGSHDARRWCSGSKMKTKDLTMLEWNLYTIANVKSLANKHQELSIKRQEKEWAITNVSRATGNSNIMSMTF